MNAVDAIHRPRARSMIVAPIAVSAALYVWIALALSAVFRKSGEEAWKAWVPILNAVVLLQLGGLSGWLLLLGLVPFLGWLAVGSSSSSRATASTSRSASGPA